MPRYRVQVELTHEPLSEPDIAAVTARLQALWPRAEQDIRAGATDTRTDVDHEFDEPVDAMIVLGAVLTCFELAGVPVRFRNIGIEAVGHHIPTTVAELTEGVRSQLEATAQR